MTAESDARAVKDALRGLVEGRGERTDGDGAAAVAAAADALSDVERAAGVAADGGFERVRAVERAAERRGDDALARRCRDVRSTLAAYRRAADAAGVGDATDGDGAGRGGAPDGTTGTDSRDAGLMSDDGLPPGNE